MAGGIKSNWSLTDVDHKTTIEGQFPIADLSATHGGNWAEQDRAGAQDAVLNWASGAASTYTFTATFVSRDASEEILSVYRAIEKLSQRDPDLKRPPICLFSYGSILNVMCVVTSVAPKFRRPKPTGEMHAVDVSISLRKYVPFRLTLVDASTPRPSTQRYVVTSAARSYEAIARITYGDPDLGDRIRQRYPEMPFAPDVGSVLLLPPIETLRLEEAKPSFHAFDPYDAAAVANVAATLAERGEERIVVYG